MLGVRRCHGDVMGAAVTLTAPRQTDRTRHTAPTHKAQAPQQQAQPWDGQVGAQQSHVGKARARDTAEHYRPSCASRCCLRPSSSDSLCRQRGPTNRGLEEWPTSPGTDVTLHSFSEAVPQPGATVPPPVTLFLTDVSLC